MDPVTTAILAAITAGIAPGATEVSKKAVVDAYDGLKTLIRRKFGENSELVEAVDKLEQRPESAGRKETLKEEVERVSAQKDPELLQSAEALLAKIKDRPGGQTIVNQVVTGDRNIFSGTGDVTVTK